MRLAAGGDGRTHEAHQNEQIRGHLIGNCQRIAEYIAGDHIDEDQHCHDGDANTGYQFFDLA